MPDSHDERGGDVADRVGRIADQIGGALDELRGLHGANRAKRGIAGAVANLRDIADEVRRQLASATAPKPLPRITDGITAAEAEASATFDLTIDEVRALNDQPLTTEEWNRLAASIDHLSGPNAWDDDQLEPALIPVTHYVPRLMADYMAAVARAEKAEAEVAQLHTEWGVRFANNQIEICGSENDARGWADPDGPSGFGLTVACRDAGNWRDAEVAGPAPSAWTDHGDGWSSRRPDASLDGLRGPFTGLIGPLGIEANDPGAAFAAAEDPPEPKPCRGCGETHCDDSRETKP